MNGESGGSEIKEQEEKKEEKEEVEGKVEGKVEEKKEKKKKKKKKIIIAYARRKEARARARIKEGKGRITINSYPISTIKDEFVKELIEEPLEIAKDYVDINSLDIKVSVNGGGVMGQAQAARSAIAKALVDYIKSNELRKKILAYDRFMLVDDVRYVEPKKYKGRKARARFQKSYR
ncbi:MAG: 30S ribosomal protein S9 [Candidatus Micrarchaeia archaeon]